MFLIQFNWCIINVISENTDDKCFQYAAIVVLNYEEIKWNPEIVLNIKPFINKYNWKGINYPSKIGDWKKFEKNNPTIALNILHVKEKKYVQLISQKLIWSVKNKYKQNKQNNFHTKDGIFLQ